MEEHKRFCTILIKRRTSGDPGPPQSLMNGELAFNETEGTLYYQTNIVNESTGLSATDLSGSNMF